MQYIYLVITFVLGCSVGSFINVVVQRTNRGESIKGRSHCEFCDKVLSPNDLFPLISFILLKGKCRYCHTKLSPQYWIIELVTGIIFATIYWLTSNNLFDQIDQLNNAIHITYYGIWIPLIYFYIVITSLIILFITDWKYGMLYDKIVIPTILFVLLYKVIVVTYYYLSMYLKLNSTELGKYFLEAGLANNLAINASTNLVYTVIGSIGIALFFLVLIIITRGRGMGGGDLKLGFLIGLLSGWPNMLISIFIGFLTGAIASCILLLVRKKQIGQTIPFGPFLIIGCVLVMFFGNQLFGWYIHDVLGVQ